MLYRAAAGAAAPASVGGALAWVYGSLADDAQIACARAIHAAVRWLKAGRVS